MKQVLRGIFHQILIIYEKIRHIDFTAETYTKTDNHMRYSSSTLLVNKVLSDYFSDMQIGDSDSIIDVGCGKGRMLYFFASKPFGRVGGIEYDEILYSVCKENLRKLKKYRINVYHSDASEFDGYDDYTYFYIFNSFTNEIMQDFIVRLKNSKRNNPRIMRVIYFNPVELEMFIKNGFVKERELKHRIVILRL